MNARCFYCSGTLPSPSAMAVLTCAVHGDTVRLWCCRKDACRAWLTVTASRQIGEGHDLSLTFYP